MNPVCILTERNGKPDWCERHQVYHTAHYRNYALDPGEKGARFRDYWDSDAFKLRLKPIPLPICDHRGKLLDTTTCRCKVFACSVHGTCSNNSKAGLTTCPCESYTHRENLSLPLAT